MSSGVLSSRDVNASVPKATATMEDKKVNSMEYHRQVLQSRLNEDK